MNQPELLIIMKRLYPILAVLALAACTGPKAPENTVRNETYRIYEGAAPGSESWDWQEYTYTDEKGDSYFTNITTPELIAYLPAKECATGAAMIVCPGGGFTVNYYTKEGATVAQWLAEHGVAAFVLKYRLVHFARNEQEAFYSITGAPAPVYSPEEQAALDAHRPVARALGCDDGRAAIAYVRSHAAEFSVKPDKIGIMGFSAGAMLTTRTTPGRCRAALHRGPRDRPVADPVQPQYDDGVARGGDSRRGALLRRGEPRLRLLSRRGAPAALLRLDRAALRLYAEDRFPGLAFRESSRPEGRGTPPQA